MLLTAKELAEALDVHITTIRRAYRSQRIPYERLYKLYFFDLEKVRSAMRRNGLDVSLSQTPRTGQQRAIAGGRRRRAATKRPRTVKRGLV